MSSKKYQISKEQINRAVQESKWLFVQLTDDLEVLKEIKGRKKIRKLERLQLLAAKVDFKNMIKLLPSKELQRYYNNLYEKLTGESIIGEISKEPKTVREQAYFYGDRGPEASLICPENSPAHLRTKTRWREYASA